MSLESDSIRAAAAEAKETVTLTRRFYSCVVKDAKTSTSGEFQAVRPQLVPIIEGLTEPMEEHADADALGALEAAIETLDEETIREPRR
jgi:hypothetical protein